MIAIAPTVSFRSGLILIYTRTSSRSVVKIPERGLLICVWLIRMALEAESIELICPT